MTIKNRDERPERRIEIDLAGPEGNAFALMGLAQRLARQLERDPEPIIADMKSGDYDHLVEVFEREFGDFVVIYK